MPPRNVDMYEKIHVIGDVHGCYLPLKEFFDKNPINENELYIFTGDYFDRGFENIDVFNFIRENIETIIKADFKHKINVYDQLNQINEHYNEETNE